MSYFEDRYYNSNIHINKDIRHAHINVKMPIHAYTVNQLIFVEQYRENKSSRRRKMCMFHKLTTSRKFENREIELTRNWLESATRNKSSTKISWFAVVKL